MPPDPRCVGSVRRFVRDLADDWGADSTTGETAELLVSEVATNALPHAPARIVVIREERLLTVEVHDRCPEPPVPGAGSVWDDGGRGLGIVGLLSRDWGWTATPTGKAVWFQLAAW
ncbi:ATP-binding protein [Actinomadura sp. ATCC 31491]|uniref:ATP-binding protein n=1 Tax=Actinomadura luzonensis TaxID=2805427 RepID=A0ABT0G5Q5_9ACTN|nr:ATP-binding protein [Actinomadura luzonensis]MCK2219942.1 ATP-binding protein [Actinomadura luzonensis]